jgi:hypothetical protein
MKISVKTLNQEKLEIEVPDDGVLLDVKNQISTIKNCSIEMIKIIFNGSVLDQNSKKLSEYKIIDGTTLVTLLQKPKKTDDNKENNTPTTTSATTSATTPTINQQPQEQPPPTPIGATNNSQIPIGNLHGAPIGGDTTQNNQNMLTQILLSHPQISQMAQQYPQQFNQILNNPNFMNQLMQMGGGTDGNIYEEDDYINENFEGEVKLTLEEKKDIDELVSMGFSFEDSVQYYMAYEKNKDLAANALVEARLEDD